MSDTTEALIAFLNARLDEKEAAAKAATPGPWIAWAMGSEGYLILREHDSFRERGHGRVARVGMKDWDSDKADAAHIALNDPARVLREVEAKRAILARHKPGGNDGTDCLWCSDDDFGYPWPCPDVLSLAAVDSGHPDYRQEWAP